MIGDAKQNDRGQKLALYTLVCTVKGSLNIIRFDIPIQSPLNEQMLEVSSLYASLTEGVAIPRFIENCQV